MLGKPTITLSAVLGLFAGVPSPGWLELKVA
jgi:hypothetical protein